VIDGTLSIHGCPVIVAVALFRAAFPSGAVVRSWLKRGLPGLKVLCPSSPVGRSLKSRRGEKGGPRDRGVDPHKRSVTLEAVDDRGRVLAARRFGTENRDYHTMLGSCARGCVSERNECCSG
jgi:hypothetical protein